jgi:beta-lactamase superfamily II metal-dependent hydrolase
MIFGDEVETTGNQQNGRDEAIYRNRRGWVRSDRLMTEHPLELHFIDVGQGDSAFIVTPAGRKILIDGGRGNEAFQFLVWKYRLDLPTANPVEIDLVVLTHADEDHIAGLVPIIGHPLIDVKEIVHSGIAKYAAGAFNTALGQRVGSGSNSVLVNRHDGIANLANQSLSENMQAWHDTVVAEGGTRYRAVDTRTAGIDVGDPLINISVLGPRLINHPGQLQPVYRWLSSASKTINGNSVVLRIDFGNVRILLPGDLNSKGARHLLADANFELQADAHVLKAPHHGSHDFHPPFLQAVHPQISVISSGETPDHGHPRANFMGMIGKMSRSDKPLLFSTELVALFTVDEDEAMPDADDEADPTDPAMIGQARRRFKKRLNGVINVRTDGNHLYAARRVAASYQFVTYGPILPSPRD